MEFIRQALLTDEKIVYFTKPHWIIFTPAFFLLLIAITVLILGPMFPAVETHILPWPTYLILAAAFALVGLKWLLSAIIVYFTAEYGVTNKRILMKVGLIRRDTSEIFLDKLEAININQTVVGRILDYGTLILIGTGGTEDVYHNIPNPLEFRRYSQRQVDSELHGH